MDPVHIVTGTVVPLERSDVDTDQIIPSEWLKRIERTGFGAGLFSEWRDEREFVLNKQEYAGASILLVGRNFGIGSSCEHAVWALVDYGFRAVVSSRIADIFKNNSTRSGLVPVEVDEELAQSLLAAVKENPSLELTIDVERRLIEAPAISLSGPFRLDDSARERLLGGLDDVGVTLGEVEKIDRFEASRPNWLPALIA